MFGKSTLKPGKNSFKKYSINNSKKKDPTEIKEPSRNPDLYDSFMMTVILGCINLFRVCSILMESTINKGNQSL